MKPTVSRAIRLGLTLVILAFLIIFATKVDWHAIGRGMRDASRPMLFAAAADDGQLSALSERAKEFGYRCWRMEVPLYEEDNFNRWEDDSLQ